MGTFRDLYRGDNDFDFPKAWRRGLVASSALIVISLVSLLTQGLNLGIDFEGGGVWEVPAGEGVSVADTRDVLRPLGQANAKIQVVTTGDSATEVLRIQAGVDAVDESSDITRALAELNGVTLEFDERRPNIKKSGGVNSDVIALSQRFAMLMAEYNQSIQD